MNLEATESIRIAEKFFPKDLTRQRELAREIAEAIDRCEADLAREIIKKVNSQAA